jgi:hypothetical protein
VTVGSGVGYDFQQEQFVADAETFLNRSRLSKKKALSNSLLDKALRNGRYKIRTCDLYGVRVPQKRLPKNSKVPTANNDTPRKSGRQGSLKPSQTVSNCRKMS